MLVFPAPLDQDVPAVAAALRTARTMWQRGLAADAIAWVRRAAQAAGDALDDERAFALARFAAELEAAVPESHEAEVAAAVPPEAESEMDLDVSVDVDAHGEPREDTTTHPRVAAARAATATTPMLPSLVDPWASSDPPTLVRSKRGLMASVKAEEDVVTSVKVDVDVAALAAAHPLATSAPSVAVEPADLEVVAAFQDLPDEAREALARVAGVHVLARGEELSGFAFALVLQGSVDVSGLIVDEPARRIDAGGVLKPKGTLAEGIPLRLVAASAEARVAAWDAAAIEPAFKACPWVEDELRADADRTIALVGVTMGSLGDALGAEARGVLASRLESRAMLAGETLVDLGEPVQVLMIVGQGVVELRDASGMHVATVGTGDALFGDSVLDGALATATAVAGEGGVILLYAHHLVAHELSLSLPNLRAALRGE
jgi:hypothetical protein